MLLQALTSSEKVDCSFSSQRAKHKQYEETTLRKNKEYLVRVPGLTAGRAGAVK